MKHTGNSKYTWDLEAILNGSSFDQLYQQWLNKQNEILKIYPHFLKSLSNFKKWLLLDDEYEILSNRVGNYVSNNYNEDLTNQK
jgi:oligoendopeptidase F